MKKLLKYGLGTAILITVPYVLVWAVAVIDLRGRRQTGR